jgi:CRISPR-associated endoribonuclease Cas6
LRCTLELRALHPPLKVPLHYNQYVQALVYRLLGQELADRVHEEGFPAGARRLRLFAFSRLLGPYALHQEESAISFGERARLVVSSPMEEFVPALARALVDSAGLHIASVAVAVESVRFDHPRVPGDRAVFRTLSPVSVYSTVARPDGTRFTYYFEPRSGEFERLATENLRRKYEALTGRPYAGPGVRWRWRGQPRLAVIRYDRGIVKGYAGTVEGEGDPVLLQLALDAGLGAKNAQGFGLLELAGARAEPPA